MEEKEEEEEEMDEREEKKEERKGGRNALREPGNQSVDWPHLDLHELKKK